MSVNSSVLNGAFIGAEELRFPGEQAQLKDDVVSNPPQQHEHSGEGGSCEKTGEAQATIKQGSEGSKKGEAHGTAAGSAQELEIDAESIIGKERSTKEPEANIEEILRTELLAPILEIRERMRAIEQHAHEEAVTRLRTELKESIEEELKAELRKELEEPVRLELRQELYEQLKGDLGLELEGELRAELRAKLEFTVYQEIYADMEEPIKRQLREELRELVADNLVRELKERVREKKRTKNEKDPVNLDKVDSAPEELVRKQRGAVDVEEAEEDDTLVDESEVGTGDIEEFTEAEWLLRVASKTKDFPPSLAETRKRGRSVEEEEDEDEEGIKPKRKKMSDELGTKLGPIISEETRTELDDTLVEDSGDELDHPPENIEEVMAELIAKKRLARNPPSQIESRKRGRSAEEDESEDEEVVKPKRKKGKTQVKKHKDAIDYEDQESDFDDAAADALGATNTNDEVDEAQSAADLRLIERYMAKHEFAAGRG